MLVSGPAEDIVKFEAYEWGLHLRSEARVGKGVVAQACSISLLDLVAGKLVARDQLKI